MSDEVIGEVVDEVMTFNGLSLVFALMTRWMDDARTR